MLHLRAIQPSDNAQVAQVIQTVMPEFNCVGEGYSINDPEVLDMTAAYSGPGSAFFVIETGADAGAKIIGVAGYAPLSNGDSKTCELRKMYILREGRGQGGGRLLMDACLRGAMADGYTRMYLETVKEMTTAASVYQKYGFEYLDDPLGNTGHCGCDRYMVKPLVG